MLDQPLKPPPDCDGGRTILHERCRLGHLTVVKHLVGTIGAAMSHTIALSCLSIPTNEFWDRSGFERLSDLHQRAGAKEFLLHADDGGSFLHEVALGVHPCAECEA